MLTAVLLFGFLAAWAALYVLVIRPKLKAYRYTAGIYAEFEKWEAGFFSKIGLILKGLKVAIVGFITSATPVAAVFYEKIVGIDWSQYLPTDKAKVAGVVVLVLGIVGPMIMVALHNGALADASAAEPHKDA